jgi:hypothetical protein
VEIDMHSEGYSKDELPVKECGDCGLVWRIKQVNHEHKVDIIKPATKGKGGKS